MTNSEIMQAVHEALIGEFVKWRLEGATHVALGCQGFEPITPQEAACRGVRAFDVDAEHTEILANMIERATQAVGYAMDLGMRAALSGPQGSA